MSTYNIDFYEDLTKIIFQLSPYHFFLESKLVCLIFALREQQSAIKGHVGMVIYPTYTFPGQA